MADAPADPAAVRDDEVVRFTSELIRIDTTNRGGGDCVERPAAEYVAARLAEAGLDPVVLESAPGRANVVARVAGARPDGRATLVHGHLDVVPAEAADWSVAPFSGEVRDGVVWGRGAVDMKDMDAMMLAVVRAWAREGRRPERDVVLAFTADEEDSAEAGARFLVERHPELFEGCAVGISESGGFTVHGDGGLRVYPVAAGERGTAWIRLTARGRAGHGSKVNRENAVTRLAGAVARIGAHEWPVRLVPTVRAALAGLAAVTGIAQDPAPGGMPGGRPAPGAGGPSGAAVPGTPDEPFDTGEPFGTGGLSDVDGLIAKLGPFASLVEPTVRNSANPTMLQAGYKLNVVPGTAVAHVDGRVLPGGEEEFRDTLDRLTGPYVDWEFEHSEIPLQAPVDSPAFLAMREAIRYFDPDGRVVPYCMSGGTDAKQFSRLGITGYGFSPLRLPPGFDYGAMYHGVDERVPVDALHFGVRVLDRFLTGAGARGGS